MLRLYKSFGQRIVHFYQMSIKYKTKPHPPFLSFLRATVYTQVGVACSTRILPPLIPPYKGGKLENLVPSPL